MTGRLQAWLHSHVPTREQLEHNRWVKPFAGTVLRSELWRFNRRSVPRGVALGLFVGVMIPLAHFVVATFIAVFVRANIPAALAATFIGFPVIYVAIVAAAYKIGELILHLDSMTGVAPISEAMQRTQTDHLLQQLTGAGLETALGLFIIATVLSSVGYLVSSLGWRWWIARKRARRLAAARIAEPAG
ncbi:MAG: DUF2062 domain-containing protein [Novosphingobium sp.]